MDIRVRMIEFFLKFPNKKIKTHKYIANNFLSKLKSPNTKNNNRAKNIKEIKPNSETILNNRE